MVSPQVPEQVVARAHLPLRTSQGYSSFEGSSRARVGGPPGGHVRSGEVSLSRAVPVLGGGLGEGLRGEVYRYAGVRPLGCVRLEGTEGGEGGTRLFW